MSVSLVNEGTAVLSMRESDFDAYSAYGEVVDNSIQARAKNIRIKISSQERGGRGKPYRIIDYIAFGDDGDGMPPEVLHRCLQLGYSTRYNDRSGIGRFGVGMTLAAINQCKEVEIYSKQEGQPWFHTRIDLDEMTSSPPQMSGIPEPRREEPPDEYRRIIPSDDRGTIVIWKKYDRQPLSAEKIEDEAHVWLGRTYRYFIWEGLNMELNGKTVTAVDPLYARTQRTAFPDDPPATLFEEISIPWPVPQEGRGYGSPETATVTVLMSLLPEEFRPVQGSGGWSSNKERLIDRNQGVSIVRNKREVFYGPIPYWPGPQDWFGEIDRWWGCEVLFDAILDRSFTVKNIKRGAVPTAELKETLYDNIRPTRDTCLERVRATWKEAKRKERVKESGGRVETTHTEAEKVAQKTPTDRSELDRDLSFESEAQKLVDSVFKTHDAEMRAQWVAKWKEQPFTIHDDHWRGPEFFEAVHLGGSDVLRYNFSHPFFEEINKIVTELETRDELEVALARRLKVMLDLLIISYSKAEAKFEPDIEFTAKDFVENFRINWGIYLKSYLATWLKENRS